MSNKDQLPFEINGNEEIAWKAQDCNNNSILFYNIPNPTAEAITKFKNRLKSKNYKYCVVNHPD